MLTHDSCDSSPVLFHVVQSLKTVDSCIFSFKLTTSLSPTFFVSFLETGSLFCVCVSGGGFSVWSGLSPVCTQSAGRVCANKPDSTRSVLVSVCTEDLTVLSMANMVLTGFVLYSSLSLAKNSLIHLQS